MKQLYIVIEKDESKSFSPIIAVCSELSIAYKHWCTYTEGSVEKEGNFRYEIVGLTLEDVDKLVGAANYLKNKIKENINEQSK